jgi:hypothetical protein
VADFGRFRRKQRIIYTIVSPTTTLFALLVLVVTRKSLFDLALITMSSSLLSSYPQRNGHVVDDDEDTISDVHTMDGTEAGSLRSGKSRLTAAGAMSYRDNVRFQAEVAAEEERVAREFGLASSRPPREPSPLPPRNSQGIFRNTPATTTILASAPGATTPQPLLGTTPVSSYEEEVAALANDNNKTTPISPVAAQVSPMARQSPMSTASSTARSGASSSGTSSHQPPLYTMGLPALAHPSPAAPQQQHRFNNATPSSVNRTPSSVGSANSIGMVDYEELSGIYNNTSSQIGEDEYSLDAAYGTLGNTFHSGNSLEPDVILLPPTQFVPDTDTDNHPRAAPPHIRRFESPVPDDGTVGTVPSVYTQGQASLDARGPTPFLEGAAGGAYEYDNGGDEVVVPKYDQPPIGIVGVVGSGYFFDKADGDDGGVSTIASGSYVANSAAAPATPYSRAVSSGSPRKGGNSSLPPYSPLDTSTEQRTKFRKYCPVERIILVTIFVLLAAIAIAVGGIVASSKKNESSRGGSTSSNGVTEIGDNPSPPPAPTPPDATAPPTVPITLPPLASQVTDDDVADDDDGGLAQTAAPTPPPTLVPTVAISDQPSDNPTTAPTLTPTVTPEPCSVPDSVGVEFYINENQGNRTCEWLATKPTIAENSCRPGRPAYDYCKYTCQKCNATAAPSVASSTAAPAVATGAPSMAGTPTPSPPLADTPAPTTEGRTTTGPTVTSNLSEVAAIILQASPDSEAALADASSPQAQALAWLESSDAYDRSTLSDEQLVQRWAVAAVLAYGLATGWGGNSDSVCSWVGVSCDASGLVSTIERDNSGLSGSIIPEIGLLGSSLTILDMGENSISGAIPTQIGSLQNLRTLRLDRNVIDGPLPESIANIGGLEELDVQRNMLTGQVPDSIASIGSLTSFLINTNDFTGTMSDDYCANTGLEIELDCLEVISSCWDRCFYQCGGYTGQECP